MRYKTTDLHPSVRTQAETQLSDQQPVIPKSRMNKTEGEYAMILEAKLRNGDILDWRFEPIKFRLGDNTTYLPDFLVVMPSWFEIHETKGGFIREDSFIKLKIAAEMYPWFIWRCMQKTKEGWHEKWRSKFEEKR